LSVLEVMVEGTFGLLQTVLSFGLMLWLISLFLRGAGKLFGGWGQPNGHLSILSPKRMWCKHRVSYRGPGTNGLWALWCSACGKKVNRK
jgi:hypothetical protein